MRRRAFPGSGPEIEQRYLRSGHWLKATIFESDSSRELVLEEWCSRGQGAGRGHRLAGEFLVPSELAQVIYDIREQYGAFRRTARIQPMASNNMIAFRRPGGTGAFFMGENARRRRRRRRRSTLVQLTAKKIGSLVLLSSEIAEDSLPDIVDFVVNEIAYAFASKEDDCAFSGDGSSTYGGMYGVQTHVPRRQPQQGQGHGGDRTQHVRRHDQRRSTSTIIGNVIGAVRASALPTAAWFISEVGFGAAFCRLAGGYIESHMVDGVDDAVLPWLPGRCSRPRCRRSRRR
jgi:HK97 family phage major capsid protein